MKKNKSNRWKRLLPYIWIVTGFIAGIIIIAIALDEMIIPAFVHDKKTVKIPKLIGKSIEEARFELEANNLSYQIKSEHYSQLVEPGIIINQNPKPYSLVKEGRKIYLIVSKGQEKVPMPYIIGKTLRAAYLMLTEKGLDIGDTLYEYSEVYMKDTIVAQSVKNGEPVPYGQLIDLVVSKGSMSQVDVPQLIGKNLSEAEAQITKTGLTVGYINYVTDNTYIANTVIDQTPKAGVTVEQNSAIDLLVTKEP